MISDKIEDSFIFSGSRFFRKEDLLDVTPPPFFPLFQPSGSSAIFFEFLLLFRPRGKGIGPPSPFLSPPFFPPRLFLFPLAHYVPYRTNVPLLPPPSLFPDSVPPVARKTKYDECRPLLSPFPLFFPPLLPLFRLRRFPPPPPSSRNKHENSSET